MLRLRLPSLAARENALNRIHIEFTRFRKLLENARATMNLFDDGREKLKGEYIFDRQYVMDLVDGVVERMGMLVFDAAVLAPEDGEKLYRLHDRLKNYAQEKLLSFDPSAVGAPSAVPYGDNDSIEPEFHLLAHALAWMTGPLHGRQQVVMDLIRETFNPVTESLLSATGDSACHSSFEVTLGGCHNCFQMIDLNQAAGKKPRPGLPQEIQCPPLGMMLVGAGEEGNKAEPQVDTGHRNWRVVIDDEHLSLRGTESPRRMILEASLGGHVDSDFIFLFAERSLDLKDLNPLSFRLENTETGVFAWSYDVPEKSLEESLGYLGRKLFRP